MRYRRVSPLYRYKVVYIYLSLYIEKRKKLHFYPYKPVSWSLFQCIYRGYYTVARRYEFYVLVARTISHSFAALTRVFLPREHKIHIFELTCNVLLYKHTDDGVFDDFPKIADHFPKISEDFPKLFRRPNQRSRTFFREFPKISEDVQRLPKIFEEDPMMFRWYTNEFKNNLRDKLDISEIIDIFNVKISYIVSFLSISYHSIGIPLTFI